MAETNGHSNPGGKHTILTIPLELFERVAELSDPRDLLVLRLVNRECGAKTLRTFKNVHSRRKAYHLASKDSLRSLLHLARNEEFACALRRLILCVDVLPRESDSQYKQWLQDPAAPRFSNDTPKDR